MKNIWIWFLIVLISLSLVIWNRFNKIAFLNAQEKCFASMINFKKNIFEWYKDIEWKDYRLEDWFYSNRKNTCIVEYSFYYMNERKNVTVDIYNNFIYEVTNSRISNKMIKELWKFDFK